MTRGTMNLREQRALASVMALREASADEVFQRYVSVYSVAPTRGEISRLLLMLCSKGVLRARAIDGITRFTAA